LENFPKNLIQSKLLERQLTHFNHVFYLKTSFSIVQEREKLNTDKDKKSSAILSRAYSEWSTNSKRMLD